MSTMKTRADEQAKFMKEEGFTAVSEKFEELSVTLGDIISGLEQLDKSMTQISIGKISHFFI